MFGIFKKKPLLSEQARKWQFETYHWLLENFGGEYFWEKTVLVQPTDRYFPDIAASPEKRVEYAFNRVKHYALMEEWPCILSQQDSDIETKVAPTLLIKDAPRGPAGSFSVDENTKQVVISYNPKHVHQPVALVATFAHELAHYLTSSSNVPPPGGWERWEPATDMAAIFLGFGIFLANSAFQFSQFTNIDAQGWRVETLGYLSEVELVYGLAIFVKLKSIHRDHVTAHLKSSLIGTFKSAFKELDNYGAEIENLKTIELKNRK